MFWYVLFIPIREDKKWFYCTGDTKIVYDELILDEHLLVLNVTEKDRLLLQYVNMRVDRSYQVIVLISKIV